MAAQVRDDPRELEQAGRLLEAIDAYTARNRLAPEPAVERRLVGLRHEAFDALRQRPNRVVWPPPADDRFRTGALPEVEGGSFGGDDVAAAVLRHGCLIVRGLLDPDQVERARTNTERAFDAYDAGRRDDPWYRPFKPRGRRVGPVRKFVADHGGLWLGDSPRALFDLFEDFRAVGLLTAIAEFLGERPAISLEKSTLRCTPPRNRIASWHQDGSFIGEQVRTVNVWAALTSCGGDDPTTPALDVLPRRLSSVVPTQAEVGYAVPRTLVEELAIDTPVVRPRFEAGDALLFDELFLHCTGIGPHMTRPRFAIESWFFAPSHFPTDYVPLVV